ncbi:MAG TPA: protein kinase [Kofleriaceae bacterium]|nr:protein kinase [Kofleriaceae bacterium]
MRQIAVGGMAEIHLAKTQGVAGFEKYVALKMIHPNFAEDEQFIQMLVDEAKIAVQLNHGNIAQTFDLGRVGDTYYITMEFVDGADMYKLLRRASEMDLEMPLDVAAFVAKEMASALDHAHRKKDHTGKSLGIVHRDVSPQNVLVSYAGEVKLVDFGIAKATMKAKQTAVGVIKGKYYYMSPEQAWGNTIDYRSDIFSAGIVLYEMIVGQMLYLEEDLHRLLDMVRKADIAPPSTIRRGVPPQLEKIVMRALQKNASDRYLSAADFASDLERFLHAYSPVFTAAKVAQLVKRILGEQDEIPEYEVELRDGPSGTLNPNVLVHEKDEIRDENSVIFRVAELKPKQPERAPSQGNRVTRQADIDDAPSPPSRAPSPAKAPQAPRAPTKSPRLPDEDTREVGPAPAPPRVRDVKTPVVASAWEHDGELENIGERTLITGGGGGFMMDVASEEGVDATMVSAGPPVAPDNATMDLDTSDEISEGEETSTSNEDGPTVTRDPVRKVAAKRGPAPAALSAKIQSPAVSELRKPRASRKTPAGGAPNVLQAIVGAANSAPMPAPPPPRGAPRSEDSAAATLPQHPSPIANVGLAPVAPPSSPTMQHAVPGQPTYNGQPYATDASGLPLAPPAQPTPLGYPVMQQPYGGYPQYPQTPPQGMPYPNAPTPPQGYAQPHTPPQGMPYANAPTPPQGMYAQPHTPPQGVPHPQTPPQGMPHMSPGAMYQLHPFGAPPQPMSLTGQMRLFEAEEIPSHYRVKRGGRWILLVLAGIAAVSVAGGVTFFVMRATRDSSPTVASIHVASVPKGAEVSYDGQRLTGATPMQIEGVPVGTRHEIQVTYPHYQPYTETVDIPKQGGEVEVTAGLKPLMGKLVIVTKPDGADVYINGEPRGHTPTTIPDIDMDSAKRLELRLKGYKDYEQDLTWPPNGVIELDRTLVR